MKKAVSLVLFIVLSLLVFVGCELTKEFTYDNIKYYVIDGNLNVLGFEQGLGTEDLYITEPPSKIEFTGAQIFEDAFANNENLRSVTVVSEIFYAIRNGAFRNCTNLKNVKVADCVVYFGVESFYGCAIEKIDLPESLFGIDEKAFAQCSLLNEIRIGSKIELIRKDAFAGCAEDLKVYITAVQPPELEGDIFGGNESVTVYVPEEAVTAYKENEYWQVYEANIIPIPAE